MTILVSLIGVIAFALIFQKLIIKHPSVFYIVGFIFIGIYLYAYFSHDAPVWLWRYFLIGVQRCTIALALFTLVMFTSVFAQGSSAYKFLYPMRRQLSILGSIFAFGHVAAYSVTYFNVVFNSAFSISLTLATSLIVALILSVLLVILAVTSVAAVHRAMRADTWKRIQKMAYPFFGLTYVHLLFVLGASSIQGHVNAIFSLTVYTVLFGSYCILRVRRHVVSSAKERARARRRAEA